MLIREVIRSRYINSTLPDMTRVTVRPGPQPRQVATYKCYVHVESRINIHNTSYDFDEKGASSTIVTVTGELYSWIYTFHLLLVVSPPTDVTVSRTGFNSALVSWSAPSSAVPAGYEVFYLVDGGSTLSGGTTSNTELTLTGLTLGTHSLFVVGYGAEGDPVLPSAHSNTASIIIGEILNTLTQQLSTCVDIPQLPPNLMLTPDSTSIMVSWMQPPYSPSNYIVSYSCQLLCDTTSTMTNRSVTVESGLNHTFSSLDPGSSCTISVVAVYAGIGMSNTVSSIANSLSLGTTDNYEFIST